MSKITENRPGRPKTHGTQHDEGRTLEREGW